MSLRNRAPPSRTTAAAICVTPAKLHDADAATTKHRRKTSDDEIPAAGIFCEDDDDCSRASMSQLSMRSVRSVHSVRSVRSTGGGSTCRWDAETEAVWPWVGAGARSAHPAVIFVLCAALAFASTYYGTRGRDAATADAAAQVMRLLHEVEAVDERALHYEEEEERLREEVERQRVEIERLLNVEREEEEQVQKVDLENQRLKRELEERERQQRKEEEERRKQQEEGARKLRGKPTLANLGQSKAAMRQVETLRQDLQEHNRQEIIDKYGNGPYMVHVQVEFPESAPGGAGPGDFTIEMAPIELVPHSILHFLDQVRHGLWDGCSFQKNALHAVVAAPISYDRLDPEPGRLEEAFRSRSLHSISFREYSQDFPHSKYTVGFDGHPGGPGWFVNVRDNFNVFGKGPPPAFGKVKDGVETVERLRGMPVETVGIHKMMVDPVRIVSMRVIGASAS